MRKYESDSTGELRSEKLSSITEFVWMCFKPLMSRHIVKNFVLSTVLLFAFGVRAETDPGYADAWSLPIGSVGPEISAPDANGTNQNFEDLRMQHGLVIFFNRSADW